MTTHMRFLSEEGKYDDAMSWRIKVVWPDQPGKPSPDQNNSLEKKTEHNARLG